MQNGNERKRKKKKKTFSSKNGTRSKSFCDQFDRSVLNFGIENSSLRRSSENSSTENRKNNFLVLGEGPTDDIDHSTPGKKV